MPEDPSESSDSALKGRVYKFICYQLFLAVVAHTLNVQSEAIIFRDACGGDLSKLSRVLSQAGAAAGFLGLVANQIGGKLSDAFGRKFFYTLGPIVQMLAGIVAYRCSGNVALLAVQKTARLIFTTFSGTVMCTAGLRDVFHGGELGVVTAKTSGIVGLAIMMGPLIESIVLQRVKTGGERITFLLLSLVGCLNFAISSLTPETHSLAKRSTFNMSSVLGVANPFGFVNIFTKGTPALKKLASVWTFQTMIDGKNMSDLSQIWMREHLKFSIAEIRNFMMGFGFASMLSGIKLTPALLKSFSVRMYTTFTNFTNLFGFSLRGMYVNKLCFFGCLPIMLPGVNGASGMALTPVVADHMNTSGFGVGESSAWLNNMRVLVSAAATLIYGYFYSWCRGRGIHPGYTYTLAGVLGAGVPQVLMQIVTDSELQLAARK